MSVGTSLGGHVVAEGAAVAAVASAAAARLTAADVVFESVIAETGRGVTVAFPEDSAASILLKRAATRSGRSAETGRRHQSQSHLAGADNQYVDNSKPLS